MSEPLKNENNLNLEKTSIFSESTKKKRKKKAGNAEIIASTTAGATAIVTSKTLKTFIILGAVLITLIVGLVLVLVLKPDEKSPPPVFDVWEGEDTFGNAAHLAYPLVEEETVTKIDLYVQGEEYSFIKFWDENLGKYDWRIKGLEAIDLDATSFEMLRMWLCTAITKDPVRNAEPSALVDYGVDKQKHNGYTLYYDSGDGEKTYSVRLGEKTSASGDTYYAYIEGRPHVYKFSKDLFTYAQYKNLKYLSPVINTFFSNDTLALMGIDSFDIYLTDGSNTSLKNVVTISVNERTETAVNFKAVYGFDEYGRRRTTVANTTFASSVFSTLYTTFSGSEVVCLSPSEDDLKKYGLDSETEKYFINVTFAEKASFANANYKNKEPSLYLSREIDGYHYVLSEYYGQRVIVKVSKESLTFLGEESYELIRWTDVNSITSGFFETLTEDDEGGVGLKEIIVNTGTNNETFILSFDKKDGLTVTCKGSDLVFKDNNDAASDSFEKNYFRNLYVYMLYFPFINSFNYMSDAETLEYIKPESIVYSITAIRNDNTAIRHTYYKKDVNYAIECTENGKVTGDGISWDEPSYGNIVTTEQISIVTKAIDKLLAGEPLLPDEDILA